MCDLPEGHSIRIIDGSCLEGRIEGAHIDVRARKRWAHVVWSVDFDREAEA